MRFDRFTVKASEAVAHAQENARKSGHPVIDVEHLAFALLEDKEGTAPAILRKVGADPVAIRAEVKRLLDKKPKVAGANQLSIANELQAVFDEAQKEADKLKDEYLSTEHLLLAMAGQRGDLGTAFKSAGVSKEKIHLALKDIRGSSRITDQDPESKYQALEKYGRDLTEAARKGKLDPVIGRDEEIRRVVQVLSRRTKNNPVLIGEPGVGKTAIVEGLAQRIVAGDVPEGLKDKQLMALDIGAMVAG